MRLILAALVYATIFCLPALAQQVPTPLNAPLSGVLAGQPLVIGPSKQQTGTAPIFVAATFDNTGGSDVTAAAQIWANSLASTGYVGVLPCGTYLFSGTVTATAPINVMSANRCATINWGGGGVAQPVFLFAGTAGSNAGGSSITYIHFNYTGAVSFTSPTPPGDVIGFTGGTISLSGLVLSLAQTTNNEFATTTSPFSAANVGQIIILTDPATGNTFTTTIAVYTNANTVTLTAAPVFNPNTATGPIAFAGTANAIGTAGAITQFEGSNFTFDNNAFTGSTPVGIGMNGSVTTLGLSGNDRITNNIFAGEQFGLLSRQLASPTFTGNHEVGGIEPYAGAGAASRKPGHLWYNADRTAQASTQINAQWNSCANDQSSYCIQIRNARGVTACNNVIDNGPRGILVGSSNDILFCNNRASGMFQLANLTNPLVGIDLQAAVFALVDDTNVTVQGNRCDRSTRSAPGADNQFGFQGNTNCYFYGSDIASATRANLVSRANISHGTDQWNSASLTTSCASGSAVITVSGANFTTANALYLPISVAGCGAAGGTLSSVIVAVNSATQVTTFDKAATTITSTPELVSWGYTRQQFYAVAYSEIHSYDDVYINDGTVEGSGGPFYFDTDTNAGIYSPVQIALFLGSSYNFHMATFTSGMSGVNYIEVDPSKWNGSAGPAFDPLPTRSISDQCACVSQYAIGRISHVYTPSGGGTVNLLPIVTDNLINMPNSSGVTINPPGVGSGALPMPPNWRAVVKDMNGNAASGNVMTFEGTLDGASNPTLINATYGKVSVFCQSAATACYTE